MRLDDVVTIQGVTETEDDRGNPIFVWHDEATVPAHVGYQSVTFNTGATEHQLVSQLQVIIESYDYDAVRNRIIWEGRTYLPDGEPMARRQHGRTHHLTIPIKIAS